MMMTEIEPDENLQTIFHTLLNESKYDEFR